MDILTLGKMNAMAKDVDQTLEFLANSTFSALKDVCDFQAGNIDVLDQALQDGLDELAAAGGGGGSGPKYTMYVGCASNNGQTGQEGLNYNGNACSWTVPDGVVGIQFDIYAGGGSGYGGCCCMMNPLPGGAGGYAVKTLNEEDGDFTPGSTVYSICAGGTGCCWPHSHGIRGFTSYITGSGLSNFCALGGHQGEHHCQNFNCYTCCHTCFNCAPVYGADYGQGGRSSWRKSSQHCASSMFQVAAGAPGPLGTGDAYSPDSCTFGYHSGGGPASPGAGGYGAAVSWPCCCGKAGGGGGVLVTYWK